MKAIDRVAARSASYRFPKAAAKRRRAGCRRRSRPAADTGRPPARARSRSRLPPRRSPARGPAWPRRSSNAASQPIDRPAPGIGARHPLGVAAAIPMLRPAEMFAPGASMSRTGTVRVPLGGEFARPVGRAAVDDHDLGRWSGLRGQGVEQEPELLTVIAHGHDDRDHGATIERAVARTGRVRTRRAASSRTLRPCAPSAPGCPGYSSSVRAPAAANAGDHDADHCRSSGSAPNSRLYW